MTIEELKTTLMGAGVWTTMQGPRLVCATDGGEWGVGGTSLRVELASGKWRLSTWVPHEYDVPDTACVVDVILDVLRTSPRALYVIPSDIIVRYQLAEVA